MQQKTLLRNLSLLIAVSIALMVLTHLMLGNQPPLDRSVYFTYQTSLSLISTVFALGIFLTFFFNLEIRRLKYNLILGNSFLLIGVLDFLSLMSLPGMPFSLSGSIETATWLWVLARVYFGIGLIWAFHIGREELTEFTREHALIISLLILTFTVGVSTQMTDVLPRFFSDSGDVTNHRILAAAITLLLHFYAIIRYTQNLREDYSPGRFSMLTGLWLVVFSQLAINFYDHPVDAMMLLGHTFKLAGIGLMFRAVFVKNVRIPYRNLYETSQDLSYSVDDLQRAVQAGTWEIQRQNDLLAKANEKLQLDLVATKAIQEAVFPQASQTLGEMTFHFVINPLDELSGDYVNYYEIDEDHTAFYIMDVAGHGVTAAMLGILAQNAVAESVRREARDVNRIMPDQVLKQLFNIYNQSPFPDEVHLVMLFGIYHRDSDEVILSTAGLNSRPILMPKGEMPQYVDLAGGFPICRLAEFVTPIFENHSIPMHPGDKLLLYTDGLIEMAVPNWNESALFRFVEEHHQDNGEELSHTINDFVKTKHDNLVQADDISFVILEKM